MPAQAVKQEGAQYSSNSTADSWCRDLYGLPISNSEIQVDSVTAKALLALPDALLRKITSAGTQHRSRLALTKSKRNDCSLSLALPTFEGSLQVPVLFCISDMSKRCGSGSWEAVRGRCPGSFSGVDDPTHQSSRSQRHNLLDINKLVLQWRS